MAYCVFTSCLSLNGSGITPYTTLDSRSGVGLINNGQMAFFGSSDSSGPLGVVIQHICGHGICRVELTGTRYGISGNDVSINIDNGNPAAVGGMLIKYQGGVAMGTGQPCGALDVYKPSSGGSGTGDNLIVRGGNSATLFGSNQIRFGFAGGIGYSHAIKSRHQSGSPGNNALDFFIWTTADAAETTGTKLVMTLDGTGNVGMGTCSPASKLHVLNSAVGGTYYGQLTVEESGEAAIQIKGTSYSSIYFSDAAAPYEAGIVYNHTLNNLELRGSGNSADLIITSGGNVGIGCSTPSTKFQVAGGLKSSGTTELVWIGTCDATQPLVLAFKAVGGATSADRGMAIISTEAGLGGTFFDINETSTRTRFFCSGNVNIGSCAATSYRLNVNGAFYAAGSSKEYKTSICEYNTDSCMFMKLKPVTYDYKEEWKHLGKQLKSGTQIGLIAEDTAEVFPELAVLKEEENEQVVRNVDYEKLSIVLLSEVQKLRREVDDLKHKQ